MADTNGGRCGSWWGEPVWWQRMNRYFASLDEAARRDVMIKRDDFVYCSVSDVVYCFCFCVLFVYCSVMSASVAADL